MFSDFVFIQNRTSTKFTFRMDLLGIGSKIDVDFILDRQEQREKIEIKVDENKKVTQYIYYDGEDVNGTVREIGLDGFIFDNM